MFYCDSKHFLGGFCLKWADCFRSWNSKIFYIYLKNILMKWADFLYADTNLGTANVKLKTIG